MQLVITRRKGHKRHPLIPGAVMGIDKGDWLRQGLHSGRRVPFWPNAKGAQFYVIDDGWDYERRQRRQIAIPAMLAEGYNHCVPGYQVEVKLNLLEKIIKGIETLIWEKTIWYWRGREQLYQNRVAEYNHNFYYQTNPYYKKKVDAEREHHEKE